MIDLLLEKPLNEILSELPISDEAKGAIMGTDKNLFYHILQITISYEKGNWDDIQDHLSHIKLEESALPELYFQAVKWTDDFMDAIQKF